MPFGALTKPVEGYNVLLRSLGKQSTLCPSVGVPHVRTSVTRIYYYAAPATITYAAFSQRKSHEVVQRHQLQQEIRDTWAEKDRRSATAALNNRFNNPSYT